MPLVTSSILYSGPTPCPSFIPNPPILQWAVPTFILATPFLIWPTGVWPEGGQSTWVLPVDIHMLPSSPVWLLHGHVGPAAQGAAHWPPTATPALASHPSTFKPVLFTARIQSHSTFKT